MYTDLDLCLAVLGGMWVGGCFGVIVGGINRAAKHAEFQERRKQFRVPAAHREFEHECDAHLPRVGE
ncbi:hypothetical protein [Paraburkholderia bryophila]|uniref:hypothetical protein n=1 Tax=Paraburkholderia bryophila TaxID=420952 RepID=UPI0015C87AC6|nr:hypothetical protein [Paraburkholderia bryophila]